MINKKEDTFNLNQNDLNKEINWLKEAKKILKDEKSINICDIALDRHMGTLLENKTAIRFIGKSWPVNPSDITDISYKNLFNQTISFSYSLRNLGMKKGDVVFTLCRRLPELYIVALSALRSGLVYSPLFSAFGPEPIEARISKVDECCLFTLASFYHKKLAPIRSSLKNVKHLIILDDDGSIDTIPNCLNFKTLLQEHHKLFSFEQTSKNDLALLHFTSGTTGKPKGALHVHDAVIYHHLSGKWALDFKADDIFWCTADPGWVTGTSYGLISPLSNGVTMIIDEAEFNTERWYKILENFKVSIWYTAPTAIRMLMKQGEELPKKYNFSSIRLAASVGEPLNPEALFWAQKNMGLKLHDNWWQTETGGIMVANFPFMDIRPGSMGKPIPGIRADVVRITNNHVEKIEQPNEQGQLAIKKGWPSMFVGYLGDEERYNKCFLDNWYLTGDLVKKDSDGYFWFVGRSDDVIKSSGHLIGPFEVENVLMENSKVLEAAVIGIPDPIAGELVKGFVVLKKEFVASEELKLEILGHARLRLGIAIAPKEITFIENLPKTKSGKIMRRLLKARELGLPEGDLSMLEQN